MIKAYKSGIPGNGQPFPEGSKIVRLQGSRRRARKRRSSSMCQTFSRRRSSSRRDSKRFPKSSGGWGYALFNYQPGADQFTADATSLSDCENACHTAVKAKDYIFHPNQKR